MENEKFSFPLFFRLKVETENVKTEEQRKNLYNWVVSRSFVRLLFAGSSRFFVCVLYLLFHSFSTFSLLFRSFVGFSAAAVPVVLYFILSASPFAHISKALPGV